MIINKGNPIIRASYTYNFFFFFFFFLYIYIHLIYISIPLLNFSTIWHFQLSKFFLVWKCKIPHSIIHYNSSLLLISYIYTHINTHTCPLASGNSNLDIQFQEWWITIITSTPHNSHSPHHFPIHNLRRRRTRRRNPIKSRNRPEINNSNPPTTATPSTRFTGGSECGTGANGYPKSGSPARNRASGSAPSPHRRWRRVRTTSPRSASRAPPPYSISPSSPPPCPAPPPSARATSRPPPPRPPPWINSTFSRPRPAPLLLAPPPPARCRWRRSCRQLTCRRLWKNWVRSSSCRVWGRASTRWSWGTSLCTLITIWRWRGGTTSYTRLRRVVGLTMIVGYPAVSKRRRGSIEFSGVLFFFSFFFFELMCGWWNQVISP